MEFFVAAAGGTEQALGAELRELGFARPGVVRGGVRLEGCEPEDGWRVCLYSRLAQRVQQPLAQFAAPDPESLYRGVRTVDWSRYLSARHTLAVSAHCSSGQMTHSGFLALKTKDAIVDQIRDRFGARPSVDRADADVQVFVHLRRDLATVYLDLAGAPLFKRGYREERGEAPLKETLAAALLRLSGWDRQRPLLDPMCGSGTIVIEAALWAGNVAPGLARAGFGFERWLCHDAEAARRLEAMRAEARAAAHGQAPRIVGLDCDGRSIELAKAAARTARVRLSLRTADIRDLRHAPGGAVIVTNPPYGKRLPTTPDFLSDMAGALCRLHGHRVCVLAGAAGIREAIPPRPTLVYDLHNGDIDCQLLVYDMP